MAKARTRRGIAGRKRTVMQPTPAKVPIALRAFPSDAWIAGQLAKFLSQYFDLPMSLLRRVTNLQRGLGVSQAIFRALAAQLSDLPFMREVGAKLSANAMNRVKTLGDLTQVIRVSLVAATAAPASRAKKAPAKKAARQTTTKKKKAGLRLPAWPPGKGAHLAGAIFPTRRPTESGSRPQGARKAAFARPVSAQEASLPQRGSV